MPQVDAQQDVRVMSMQDNDTHLVTVIHRRLDTCDRNDWKIQVWTSTYKEAKKFSGRHYASIMGFERH